MTEKLKTMPGNPELGETRGAQHEGVPKQSHGVQEQSHGAHDGGDGGLSQPRAPCWKIDNISICFNFKPHLTLD